jgi:hypothetical protein
MELINVNLQTVCNNVRKLITASLPDDFLVNICNRLVVIGCVPSDDDIWLLAFSIQKVEQHILNATNQATIPEGLIHVAVDMICGEVINTKYLSGKLKLDDLDLSGVIQTVTEGDTSVTFTKDGSDLEKMKGLLKWLMDGKGCDFLCYRKMQW